MDGKQPADATTADRRAGQRRKALEEFMRANELRASEWAAMAGLANANAIYNFLAGRSASLNQTTYERLAAAIPGCSVAQLTGEAGGTRPTLAMTISVRAEAAGGVWRASPELAVEEQVTAAVPIGVLSASAAFGVRVAGRDMDRVFPVGSLVVCVPIGTADSAPRHGSYVLVHARDGRMWEVTLRQYRLDREGAAWLWPHSESPEFQAPWRVSAGSGSRAEGCQVVAVAIGAYLQLV